MAAIVSQFGPNLTHIYTTTKKMGKYEEIIKDFPTIIESHLDQYQKTLNCAPENVVIYRDGVSEGQ